MKQKLIVWSVGEDEELSTSAKVFADRHNLRVLRVIEEVLVIRGLKRLTMLAMAALEAFGVVAFASRAGDFHPAAQNPGFPILSLSDLRRQSPLNKPKPKPLSQSQRHQDQDFRDRLFNGRVEGAKAGRHVGGPPPYGYRRTANGLVPDERESAVVKRIFSLYARLRSVQKVCKVLEGEGLKTRRRRLFSRHGVNYILKNRFYIGAVRFNGVSSRGAHTGIIAPIVFNKAGLLLKQNNKKARRAPKEQR